MLVTKYLSIIYKLLVNNKKLNNKLIVKSNLTIFKILKN